MNTGCRGGIVCTLLIVLALLPAGAPRAAIAATPAGEAAQMVQFKAGSHVLGFDTQGVTAASADHALRITFVGAHEVTPEAAGAPADGEAMALDRVIYAGVWEGVRLVYEGGGSALYATTYEVAPGADASRILLRYSAPVALNSDGTLAINLGSGAFTESAPIAWQVIGGRRVPVDVSFRVRGREVGFAVGAYDTRHALTIDPSLRWNTFLGAAGLDSADGIARDSSGNLYVAGSSAATWGTPVRAFGGGVADCYVAKLDEDGALLWNTFLGGGGGDGCYDIEYNGSALLVAGVSGSSWGSPVRAFTSASDVLVAQLNASTGALGWHTFLGGSGTDVAFAVSFANPGGYVYVAGSSDATWGSSPKRIYSAGNDGFAAKLSSAGVLDWHMFAGGAGNDVANDLHALSSGAIYVVGSSNATWGAPTNSHAGGEDAFIFLLDGAGLLQWLTFMGSAGIDRAQAIYVANAGAEYVAGYSSATWGSPKRAFSGVDQDAFLAKVAANGSLTWHTFLGGGSMDRGRGVTADGSGNVYVTGSSHATWGSPLGAYTAMGDAFVAKLTSAGALTANTFIGGAQMDIGHAILTEPNGNPVVAGISDATWGSPVRAYTASDGFVAGVDLERPTVTDITLLDSDPTSEASVEFEVSFSEPVASVDLGDFGINTTGSLAFVSKTGVTCVLDTCTVTVNTGSGEGTIQLRVLGWADIFDLSGNDITGLPYMAGPAYTVDKTPPTVLSIVRAGPSPTAAGSVDFLVTFSEPVNPTVTGHYHPTTTGAVSGAFTASLTGSGATRTVTVNTGSGSGTLRLDMPPVIPPVRDLALNPLVVPYMAGEVYTIDKDAPAVAMSSAAPNPTSTSPIPVTVQFSEPVTGFAAGDITPGNATVNGFAAVDADTYTFNLAPTAAGAVTANIAAGVATDAVGNDNTVAPQFARTFTVLAPSVMMSSPAPNPTSTSPIPVTVQFSEPVTGFAAGDITPGNGSVSDFVAVDADTYTFNLTPAAPGLVTADIAAGVAFDTESNGNIAAPQFARTFTVSAPSVMMSSPAPQPTSTSPIPVTVQFSEPVTGFAAGDITPGNGSVSDFVAVDADTYTFNLTPATPGLVTADIAAGVAFDTESNGNIAAPQFSRAWALTNAQFLPLVKR